MGAHSPKIDWIYRAIVRPKLSYGALVWAAKMTSQIKEKLMTKLQRLALLFLTQPLRSAPTAGLEVMIGWQPLELAVQEKGLCTLGL